MKLNVKIKNKWVAALRSGKYTQGKGQLCEYQGTSDKGVCEYNHCCLGVLAHLCGVENEKMSVNGFGLLDASMKAEIGTDKLDKIILEVEVQDKLAKFNDGARPSHGFIVPEVKPRSFKWIASYIERYL